MRIATIILLIGMTVMLLSCGLADGGQNSSEGANSPPVVTLESAEPQVELAIPSPVATPDDAEQAQSIGSAISPPAPAQVSYLGPTSLEERIFSSPVIVRVRLDSATSTLESATTVYGTKYMVILEFSFSVLDYLKGTGANDIVAVWAAAPLFDTRQEAEAALLTITAARDTQWDDREAILFLQDSISFLTSTEQADRYYLSWGGSWTIPDDGYSIASIHDKLWLPAEAAVGAPSQPSDDQQRFLIDVPPASGTTPTITLGELKMRIAAVTAKLNAGDDSEEYRKCVVESYRLERRNRHLRETQPDRVATGSTISPPHLHQFDSGLAGGTVVYVLPEEAELAPGVPFQVWLDGGDANLFSAATPSRSYRVTTTRPLLEGEYRFYFNHRGPFYSLCDGWTIRYEWTVTVTAPEGTLHEAFFDPVTVGAAVLADSANGVLKPSDFTDANDASATIQRIAWEAGTGGSGTVKLKLSPHDGIAGHTLHFIALDGSVPLSLKVADATVDSGERHPELDGGVSAVG